MSRNEKCSEYCHMLSDFIDGDLPFELCERLEDHLQNCDNCRIVLNTLKKTIEIYQETKEPVKMPGAVRERLFKTLSLEEYLKK